MCEWQQQVGHGQAEFNKQKHMCPAVPLAFPWSGVWAAELGSAAGPAASAADLYRSRKLLTLGTVSLPHALLHLLLPLLPGEAVAPACQASPALQRDGQAAAVSSFSCFSSSVPLEGFACICLNGDSPKGAPAGEEQRCRHHLSPGSWPGCDKHFYTSS